MRAVLIVVAFAGVILALSEKVGYDYYIHSQEIGTGLALVQAFILFFRANKRWSPVLYFARNKETVPMRGFYTGKLKSQLFFTRSIELFLLATVGFGLFYIADTTSFLGRIMLYGAVENIIYMFVNKKANRFGFIVNEKAILSFTDKLETITWENVRLVEEKYGELFFTEKEEKVTVFKLQFLNEKDTEQFLSLTQEHGEKNGFGEVVKI